VLRHLNSTRKTIPCLWSVYAYVQPGWYTVSKGNGRRRRDGGVPGKDGYRNATEADAIRVLYEKANSLGADGAINIEIKYHYYETNKVSSFLGVSATGMAIKRK
jgi:hypothetical protein